MNHSKKILSIALTLCMVLSMLPATAWAIPPSVINITTSAGYTDLSTALAAAADGDTIQLQTDITESAGYYAPAGTAITIDGQGYTITGADGGSGSVALDLDGSGTVILKRLKLVGGSATDYSIGLNITQGANVVSIETVTATGGLTAGNSYGINDSSTGIVYITTATGGTAEYFSYGASNQGGGTINVVTATGGTANNSSYGISNSSGNANVNTASGSLGVIHASGGTVNVNTATGTSWGINNISAGTVNVNTPTSTIANQGSGTVNISDTSGAVIMNDNGGTINTGTSVAALTLHKGTGASCVLDTITVAKSGILASSLPSVYKDGIFGDWYTDEAKTTLYADEAVTDGMDLYSTFYEATPIDIAAVTGIAVPVRGGTPTASIAATSEYTAAIAWSGNPSVFAADTVYIATVTLTPKAGYTVSGISHDFFTVSGATASNSADSGVVTAVFPATAASSSGGGGGSSVVTYTVTFHSNGGTQISSASVRSGNTVSAPADPAKEGFTFAGWYKDAELTKAYNFSTSLSANTALYAKWTAAPVAAQQFSLIFNIGEVNSYLTTDSAVKTLRTMDAAPILSGDRTFLPIRYVLEPMGGTIAWDQTEKKVTITNGTTTIELWIGSNMAKVNGVSTMIDPDNADVVPLLVKPGRTMLPLRFISETLGYTVKWDQATKQVTVTKE